MAKDRGDKVAAENAAKSRRGRDRAARNIGLSVVALPLLAGCYPLQSTFSMQLSVACGSSESSGGYSANCDDSQFARDGGTDLGNGQQFAGAPST